MYALNEISWSKTRHWPSEVWTLRGINTADEEQKVCKLKKALYGLKQSARSWNQKICYVTCIWLFVKRLSQKAIQRRSQRDRLVKIKVCKLRRDADDIPCNITLRSAGGESFHSAGPTTAKARFWNREVRDQGIRRSQRSAERSGREEREDGGLDMISHRYFGARPCWDLATMGEVNPGITLILGLKLPYSRTVG